MAEKNRLPRRLCLNRRADIQRLLKCGRRKIGEYFVCVWQPSDEFAYVILVSGNVKPAVRRNWIKRLVREVIRQDRHQLTQPIQFGLMTRRNIGKLSFKDVRHELRQFIEAINAVTG